MYEVRAGDTFNSISRKLYGTDLRAAILAAANPGVTEPLTPGIFLVTPLDPAVVGGARQTGAASNPEEVALLIDGERFRFWSEITIQQSIDGLSVVSFRAPFEADNAAFKKIFRPFSFQSVVVTLGGEPFFAGTMLTPTPSLEADSRTVEVSCYSLPGVLQDCTAPASSYPLEFISLNFSQIAEAVLAPFGLAVILEADPGPAFDRVALDPGARIWSFLAKLAKQRNLILSDTPAGALLVRQSVQPGQPVAILEQGQPPLDNVSAQFNPQQYYSHITGLRPAYFAKPGEQFTVKNERLRSSVRPFTFKADDTAGGDIETATRATAGRMAANSVSYSVSIPTWRTALGILWAPNTTIKLTAPGVMVYTSYEFIVRAVTFSKTGETEQAMLDLVMPGAFSGEIPEAVPWD